MSDRINDLLKRQPGLGIARRSAVLVAASGPYHPEVGRKVNKVPMSNMVLGGVKNSLYIVFTVAPQRAIEEVADNVLGGKPVTPEQIAARKRILLAGNAAIIVAGMLGQRLITHSRWSGRPGMEMGRLIASQVAIGGAAGMVVLGSDSAFGPLARRKDEQSLATIAVSAGIWSVNRKALRKAASVVTLSTTPSIYTYAN
jgi:hypothetical protein